VSRSALSSAVVVGLLVVLPFGCGSASGPLRRLQTPAEAGLNTNNLIDPMAQPDADDLGNVDHYFAAAERLRPPPPPPETPRKSILCLSGGGAYGAFSAGVLCGWTQAGDRPGTNGRRTSTW
jgi:hypothetical protein